MKRVALALAAFAAEIADAADGLGGFVEIDLAAVADRSDSLALSPPGVWSANRACRMVRAADGWLAVNLPRESDLDLLPAWIGCRADAAPWPAVIRAARRRAGRDMVEAAARLGLPVCAVGEVRANGPEPETIRMAPGAPRSPGRPPIIIDLTSLWAGPLCGSVLAQAGAAVTKIQSRGRPDTLADSAPTMFRQLNGGKSLRTLDFQRAADVADLTEAIDAADGLITSARPRAFDQLGLSPAAVFARNPGLTWVAVTGHGWAGGSGARVAFGDDAAAAGGLVRFTPAGDPRFIGDALADPLTGLAAAAGALRALAAGGGVLVDAAMARTAAAVAAWTSDDHGAGGRGRTDTPFGTGF